MSDNENLWYEIPSTAWISLARRGMESISLAQCFLKNCDNEDIDLLEPFKKEESDDNKKHIKKIHIKCKKCGGIFQLKFETIKRVAKPKNMNKDEVEDDQVLSIGLVYALDEENNNLGHIGYF
ncbi:MAG: hypothetical protein EU529_09735 [Promethearchaeota archaeon]|nr:MAG: hypothetical protein EU529_09735 [Candidatus Lokiarchaeota archaeon]